MDFEKIITQLTRKGAFIHSDGEFSDNYVEAAAIATRPEWIEAALYSLIPVFRKLKTKKIALIDGMDVAVATHISKALDIPLLVVPLSKHAYTQTIRGDFKKNEQVAVFSTLLKNPSRIFRICEILKKNGLVIDNFVVLINRNKDLASHFEHCNIRAISVFDYPADKDCLPQKSKEYLQILCEKYE